LQDIRGGTTVNPPPPDNRQLPVLGKGVEDLPTYLLFIDYEKAYDNLNHGKIWKILTEEKIPPYPIEAIKICTRIQ
jgi:hypothetical protein